VVDDADKCPGCGTRSHEADDYYPAKVICRVCKSIQQMDRANESKGTHVVLRRREV